MFIPVETVEIGKEYYYNLLGPSVSLHDYYFVIVKITKALEKKTDFEKEFNIGARSTHTGIITSIVSSFTEFPSLCEKTEGEIAINRERLSRYVNRKIPTKAAYKFQLTKKGFKKYKSHTDLLPFTANRTIYGFKTVLQKDSILIVITKTFRNETCETPIKKSDIEIIFDSFNRVIWINPSFMKKPKGRKSW